MLLIALPPPHQLGKESNEDGYNKSYYGKMSDFMQGFFSASLKDNSHLHSAVLTGILRVARESIFSGLNNVTVYSVLNDRFSPYFGFSQDEVCNQLQNAFGTEANERLLGEVEEWYGGYQMGKDRLNRLFNPWSVSNFIEKNRKHERGKKFDFEDHWINSSENKLIKDLLKKLKSHKATKDTLLQLVQNQAIVETINEHTVFYDVGKDPTILWSFLLLSGYLTTCQDPKNGLLESLAYHLIIPNKELYTFYVEHIKKHIEPKKLLPGFKPVKKSSDVSAVSSRSILCQVENDDTPEPREVRWHLLPSGSCGALAPCFKPRVMISSPARDETKSINFSRFSFSIVPTASLPPANKLPELAPPEEEVFKSSARVNR